MCKYVNFYICIEDFYLLWKFKIYNLLDSIFFLMCVYLCGFYKLGFYINELIKNVFRNYLEYKFVGERYFWNVLKLGNYEL